MLSNFLAITIWAISGIGPRGVDAFHNYGLNDEVDEIVNHLDNFSSSMRVTLENAKKFYPSRVENACLLFDKNGVEPFAYLDFDDNNGYAVLANGMEMPWFCPIGQITQSNLTKSCFCRGKGIVVDTDKIILDFLRVGNYSGQESDAIESGKIIDPLKYVKDRYGDGWDYEGNYLPYWNVFHRQDEFSIYAKEENDGTIIYENNCLLASIYEILDYWRYAGYLPSLTSGYVSSSPLEDWFYSSLMKETNSSGKARYSVCHSSVPTMYKIVRDWFRDNDSYVFGPASASKATSFIQSFNSQYGLSMTSRLMDSWDVRADIASSAKAPSKMYIWNQRYGDYGSHSMPVWGAFIFQKTSGWWIFSHTDYVNLMRVNDNYVEYERYIDMTAYENEHPCSGSFIEIAR